MRYLTALAGIAAIGFAFTSAHAKLFFPAAFPATYDVLICQQGQVCSFELPQQADYSGTLVLLADSLTSTQLELPGKRRYMSASMDGDRFNACFYLQQKQQNPQDTYYISHGGMTTWGGDDATIYLGLGSGVDAGYGATLTQANGDGLTGTGASWGTGVAAPDDMRRQTIIARRRGKPDLSFCPTVSTEPDPAEARAMQLHHQLVDTDEALAVRIAARLNASKNPRDWAVATLFKRGTAYQQPPDRVAKLERAMRESNDPLVYWIALHDSHKSWNDDAAEDMAVRTLPQIEPDNIAVWIEPLALAVKRKDEAAASNHLAKMAAATHYDSHATSILGAMLDAYKSVPMSLTHLHASTELIEHLDARTAPYYLTQRRGMLCGGGCLDSDLPGLRDFFSLCRDAAEPKFDALRVMLCAHIARTLAAHSASLGERGAGFELLRTLQVYDDADSALARRQNWLVKQFASLAPNVYSRQPDAAASQRFVEGLIQADNDPAALRRWLASTGKAVDPPSDYPVPSLQPAERLSETRRRVWGPLALWIARLTAPPGVWVMDAYY